jgi:hypothetical protein
MTKSRQSIALGHTVENYNIGKGAIGLVNSFEGVGDQTCILYIHSDWEETVCFRFFYVGVSGRDSNFVSTLFEFESY